MSTMFNEVILHHSAVASHYDAPIANSVDSIKRYHKSRGYNDIGYHFLINYDSYRYGRSSSLNGAHCYGHNDTLGVCFLGDYTKQSVNSNQICLLFYILKKQILSNCLSKHFYITPHCYYRNTLCPGNIMPAVIEYLRISSDYELVDVILGKSVKLEVRYVSEIH